MAHNNNIAVGSINSKQDLKLANNYQRVSINATLRNYSLHCNLFQT